MLEASNQAVVHAHGVHGGRSSLPSVAIVGLGYVGLPTAIALRAAGHPVLGIDTSADRLRAIRTGRAELLDHEQHALHEQLAGGAFALSTDPALVADADAAIVAVPTPIDDQRQPDLRPLRAACKSLVEHAREGQTFVLTSTTSVGSTRSMVVEPLAARGLETGRDVHVAFAPERIDPGVRAHAQQRTPRVVGGVTEECFKRAYAVLKSTCSEVHGVSSPEAAELVKLCENSFRATNIALAFEFSEAACHYGLDPIEVIDAAATKPYAFMAHYPSSGVGGHCIGVDPHYLLDPLNEDGVQAPVLEAAMLEIAQRPQRFAHHAAERVPAGGRVLVVGACYKPGVADLRESAALEIISELEHAGVAVDYHDPLVAGFEHDGRRHESVPASAAGYDVVILCISHPGQDLSWLADAKLVIDGTYRTPVGAERELL